MKITVVPAQVTTVEDKIMGSLSLSQLMILLLPVFIGAALFAILPPAMGSALYKYILIGILAVICLVLSIRIKGKIVALWIITILRYNLRPKYYLFNKNVMTLRADYAEVKQTDMKAEKSKKTKEMSQFEVLKNTISGIRSIRTDYRVTPQTKVHVVVNAGKDKEFFTTNGKIIEVLGRVEPLEIKERAEKPHHAAGFVLGSIEVFIDLEGVVDFEKERARLEKEVATVAPYAKSLEKKLSVGDFAKHAPPDVVEKEKQKLAEAQEKLTKLNEQLKQLS
jgi:hypothetical protein